MNNAWNLLRAQDTVASTVFWVLFSIVGGRGRNRSEKRGSGAARRVARGSAASL